MWVQCVCVCVCVLERWQVHACVYKCKCVRTSVCVCVDACGSVRVLYVCILAPLSTLCGTVSGDADLFLSRLINEEIKVSVSQSRHKDTGGAGGGSDTQLVPLKF